MRRPEKFSDRAGRACLFGRDTLFYNKDLHSQALSAAGRTTSAGVGYEEDAQAASRPPPAHAPMVWKEVPLLFKCVGYKIIGIIEE